MCDCGKSMLISYDKGVLISYDKGVDKVDIL